MREEHPLTSLTAFLLLLLLTGSWLLTAAPAQATKPTPFTDLAQETVTPPQATRPPEQATRPPVQDDADRATPEPAKFDALTERVAKALGLRPEALTVISTAAVTWPDSCLGCPAPNTACLTVLTPGQQVIYQGPGGQRYDVRTGNQDHFIICQQPAMAATPTPYAVILPVPPAQLTAEVRTPPPNLDPPPPVLEAAPAVETTQTYRIVVTNVAAAARDATVEIPLPPGVAVTGIVADNGAAVTAQASQLQIRVAALPPGGSAVVLATVSGAAAEHLDVEAAAWHTAGLQVALAVAADTGFVTLEPLAPRLPAWIPLSGAAVILILTLIALRLLLRHQSRRGRWG